MGYPASGVFATLNGGYGQYFCDTTWDGCTEADSNTAGNTNVGMAQSCLMTGGASGGPTS